MKKIKFQGHEIEYDERKPRSWKFQRLVASANENPNAAFEAIDSLLLGRADEISELLGDDVDVMGELATAIINECGGTAKN